MSDKTREQFEAWAAAHGTLNFSRDEVTGMYCMLVLEGKWKSWLASRKSALEEAKAMADAWTRADAIKLAAGEMTAQELRTAQAVARGISAAIRAAAESRQGGETS